MSRVGKMPIAIPKGVDVTAGQESISVKRSLGTLTRPLSPLVDRSWGEQAAWFADPDGNVVAVAQTELGAA